MALYIFKSRFIREAPISHCSVTGKMGALLKRMILDTSSAKCFNNGYLIFFMPKLVDATEHRCAGLVRDPDALVQIETTADEGAHDIGVQHFDNGLTRVLCGHVRGMVGAQLCGFVHVETKGGEYRLTKKVGPCPFSKGPIDEEAEK